MFENNSKKLLIFGLIPFALWLMLVLKGEIRIVTIIIGALLFTVGYGVSSFNKVWIVSSIIALIICCIVLFIMGLRNDYFKLLECYMSIAMAIYYGLLHLFNFKRRSLTK